jgi:YbgC/YbaW family acyl-CoA thioester hydrolase
MIDVAELEREPGSEIRVRMRDCDVHGHLHNTRYVDYLLDARDDQLRAYYDFDMVEVARRTGIAWYVVMTQARFYEPARIGALLRAVTRLISYDQHRFVLEGRLYGQSDRLSALIWFTFRAVDVTSAQPTEHSHELMALFGRLVLALPGEPAFEARARSVER